MSQQIMTQPDGRLALFSTIVSAFVLTDATPEQVVHYFVQDTPEMREEIEQQLATLRAHGPAAVYGEDALSWTEAEAIHQATEEAEAGYWACLEFTR